MTTEINDIPHDFKEVFAKVLRVSPEEINRDSGSKTTRNWDSLRHVELVVAVEEKYNVSFSPFEVFALTSVQGFCDMLAKKNVDVFKP
jgi:acyl carrier protein